MFSEAIIASRVLLVRMAVPSESPNRVWVEIGPVPGRLLMCRTADVYRAEKPLRFVSRRPEPCDPRIEYWLVERFPIEIEAFRAYSDPDDSIPLLVQAFKPPLVLADGNLLDPTIPVKDPDRA